MSEEGKWGSVQIVLNNNAGDIHPIDTKMRDENGDPVVIGVLPLTANVEKREKELKAYVDKYYNGEIPAHLQPVLDNINAEKTTKIKSATEKVISHKEYVFTGKGPKRVSGPHLEMTERKTNR